VCFLGAVAGYALVRERDFVPSYAPAHGEAEAQAAASPQVTPDPAGAT
jgi:hypothetical protein